jgi:ribosomal protein S10
MHAKISIVLKSFEVPPPLTTVGLSKSLSGAESASSRALRQKPVSIRLPKRQALFTVLRSPHIDKKSREQFAMRIHKQLIVIQTETSKLREKLLRFQLPDLSGVQLKVIFQYQTRLHTF